MKNMKYSMIFGIALVCAMLFTACNDIFETPVSNNGRISVSLTGVEDALQAAASNMARTVFPSTVFDKYVYTFTKAGETTGVELDPDNEGYFILEIGNYTVEVKAYTGNTEPYTLAASGVSSEFNVGSGNNYPVEVILTEVDTGGEGVFSYTITYPAGVVAEINLHKWPDLDDITLTPANLTEGNGITETLQLDAGSYLLTVLVSKTGLYAGISEAVHIYPNTVNEYIKDFDDEDMATNAPPMTNEYTISGIGTFTYNGTARTVNITPKETASPGAITTILYNGTADEPIDAGTYSVTFDVEAAKGWSAANGLPAGTITIDRADGAAVSAPTGTSSITNASISINPVDEPDNGQTVEYAKNTTDTAPSTGWQDDTTFSGLLSFTPYYFFARSAQNTNYNAGAESTGYLATTGKADYAISINPSETYTFTAVPYGYGARSERTVTINNIGINSTGALTIELSGANTSNFALSTTSISSIAAEDSDSFTIVPNTGLNAGTYTATVTVSGDNNISAALDVSFTVNKASGAAVSAPTGTSSITNTSITVNAVTAPANGQTVEYAINTSNSVPSSGWQTSTYFGGLPFTTAHYIFARSAENTNYNAGTASSGYRVTTTGPDGTEANPFPLTENLWEDGSITTTPNGEVWYSFYAAANTTYRVWWNDSYGGDYTKTLDVRVTAFDSSGTQQFNQDSGWGTPQTITKVSGTTIKLKVTPYSSSGTGTFAIGYSTGSDRSAFRIRPPVSTTSLTANTWRDGNITSSVSEIWYSFTATAGTKYGVWWNDSNAGDGSKTLDVQVRAYDSNGTELFNIDNSWTFNLASTINTTSGGTIYLRVLPRSGIGTGTGTFGIRYNTGFVRGDIGHTTLTANQWRDGTIGVWGETWYSFTATAGTTYRVWWNDSFNGNSTKNVDVLVAAYDSNGTRLFSQDSGWDTPQTITLLSGSTIYLRVTPYSGSAAGGTFAVVYSTGTTRP